jgi:hypothetical protein
MKIQGSLGTLVTINPASQLHIPNDLNSQRMLLFMNDFSLSYWSHGPINMNILLFLIYIAYAYNWKWGFHPEEVEHERGVLSAVLHCALNNISLICEDSVTNQNM